MIFSFITPKQKPIFSPITRSWLVCFLASVILVIAVLGLLRVQSDRVIDTTNHMQGKIDKQYEIRTQLEKKLTFLQDQTQEIKQIKEENTTLFKAIANLFDLIPNQITINTISLTDQSLTIKGITPSKELYVFLLEAPLRAIFTESRVDFFVLPSGWYNFVSVSKIIRNDSLKGEK